MDQTLDMRGQACPIPVINAKKAIEGAAEAGKLTVLVDNETSVKNLTKLAQSKGLMVTDSKKAENEYAVVMHLTGTSSQEKASDTPAPSAAPAKKEGNGTTVALCSQTMGVGDDKLGKSLMKAYMFALTNLDELPATILCYNGGALLTCEGSDSLEDLKNLESQGVTIKTCGTCLNFYGLTEKLAVGTVTNMYDIADTLSKSSLVIRP